MVYGSGLLYMLLNTQLLRIQKSLNGLPKLWMLYPVQGMGFNRLKTTNNLVLTLGSRIIFL